MSGGASGGRSPSSRAGSCGAGTPGAATATASGQPGRAATTLCSSGDRSYSIPQSHEAMATAHERHVVDHDRPARAVGVLPEDQPVTLRVRLQAQCLAGGRVVVAEHAGELRGVSSTAVSTYSESSSTVSSAPATATSSSHRFVGAP
ncbi:hypothetical protein RKD22_000154 [Streptomyces pristinaespiralis]